MNLFIPITYPLCPPHLHQLIEDAVEAFDNAWLLPPSDREVFVTARECLPNSVQAWGESIDEDVIVSGIGVLQAF